MSELWYCNKKQLFIIETSDFHKFLHLSSLIILLYKLKLSACEIWLRNLGSFLLQLYGDNWLSKAKWSKVKIIFSALISEPFQTLNP